MITKQRLWGEKNGYDNKTTITLRNNGYHKKKNAYDKNRTVMIRTARLP